MAHSSLLFFSFGLSGVVADPNPSPFSPRAQPRDLQFNLSGATNLSSRPEKSWACCPPKVMKNAFSPATALHGSAALSFVIPSEAEGSAVPRTIPGNVFRQGVAKWRDLLFARPASPSTGSPVCSSGAHPDFLFAAPERAACAVFSDLGHQLKSGGRCRYNLHLTVTWVWFFPQEQHPY